MNHLQDLQEENCKLRSELTALTASVEEKDRELAIANGMLTFMRDVQDTNADLRTQLAAATKSAEESYRHAEAEDRIRDELTKRLEEAEKVREAFSQAYYLITGKSPQWAPNFTLEIALEEIDGAQRALRLALKQ
jgi:chromosome segregation ATPase